MPTITLIISCESLDVLSSAVSSIVQRCVRDGSISVNVSRLDDSDDLVSAKAYAEDALDRVSKPHVPEPVAKPTITDAELKARWFDMGSIMRDNMLIRHVCTTCRARRGEACKTAGGSEYHVGMGHAARARIAARAYFGIVA